MKPKINCISITCADLQKSYDFYRHGLGLSSHGIRNHARRHACFRLGNNLDLVIYDCEKTAEQKSGGAQSMLLISHYAESKQEVDAILKKALTAGAIDMGVAGNEPWRYAVHFADPDGYLWEIVWEA